jgi:hypothetical protein
VDSDHAIVHFALVAEPLSPNRRRMRAALGRARFINGADRLGMGMVFGHDLLTTVTQLFLIPLDEFEKTL